VKVRITEVALVDDGVIKKGGSGGEGGISGKVCRVVVNGDGRLLASP
jgi:hypothetical protein